MAANAHSAAGQALGYFHQCMWALVELGRRASDDPAVELRLEGLDDIQFDSNGAPSELLQTKHQIGSPGSLAVGSVDLWRTLNVWMDLADDRVAILRLVTTQEISDSSPLRWLRDGPERDTAAALEALLVTAAESDTEKTKAWRKKLLDMDPLAQDRLVDRISITDRSSPATELDSAIGKTFRYATSSGKELVFAELLKGWWAGICVQLLSGKLGAVTGDDLLVQVRDIADQLKVDNLPIDPEVLRSYDESIGELYQDRPFVQQLLWIAFDNTRLWKAIRDYHRAYTQRSFWLRHQLLAEPELDRFAFRLHDEWEQVFDSHIAAMSRSGRTDAEAVGQEILESLARESRVRLRDRFDEPWFSRGMFHALADGELGARVGWHPDFEAKLEELLSHA